MPSLDSVFLAASYQDEIDAKTRRIAELEAALRSLTEMETNRYACGAAWHDTFAKARKTLEQK